MLAGFTGGMLGGVACGHALFTGNVWLFIAGWLAFTAAQPWERLRELR
jgi:hypothetical protein